jgi:predicted transglutaminase-like cysteine proteinase
MRECCRNYRASSWSASSILTARRASTSPGTLRGRAQAGLAHIGIINRAINLAIHPTSDLARLGVIDRWSAPLVTLAVEDSKVRQMAPLFVLDQSGVRKVVPTITAVARPASAPREGAASAPGSL